MATTLDVSLDPALQSQLSQDGVYFQVVLFGNSQSAPLYSATYDGKTGIPSSIQVPLTADGQTLDGGKVYFIIQSVDAGDPAVVITDQSQINWESAQANDYRYDSIEVSLLNKSGDAANLTSVEGFGIPMELSVSETGTRSYDVAGWEMFKLIDAAGSASTVYTYTEGPLKGMERLAASPTTAVPNQLPGYAASDWDAYIASLETSGPTGVAVNGFFNGAPDVTDDPSGEWHNAGYFSYVLEWDPTYDNGEGQQPGTFWLSPTAESQIQGYIRITPEELSKSIYSSLGTVEVYTSKTDAEPYMIYDTTAEMNVGANNQWGKVLQQFTIGFTAGYYGVEGQSLNSEVTEPIDLNKNWNWDPTYAFGNNLYTAPSEPPPFSPDSYLYKALQHVSGGLSSLRSAAGGAGSKAYAAALGGLEAIWSGGAGAAVETQAAAAATPSGAAGKLFQAIGWLGRHVADGGTPAPSQPIFMDAYSKVFFDHSNSYGSTYSDALMAPYSQGGPLLPVYSNGANVSTINLKLYADGTQAKSEVPAGYTPPAIANYIAPGTANGHYAPVTWEATAASITLNFGPGEAMLLKEDVPITFRFITGYDGDTPIWDSIELGGDGQSPWQNWTVTYADGAYSLTGTGGAGQTPGSLVITAPPMAEDGVAWYQIVVGEGETQKTYNLYTTTSDHEFVNPADADHTTYAADGLATVVPGALEPDGSLLSFAVTVTGTTPTLDLSLLENNTTPAYIASLVPPSAPVAGTLGTGGFTAAAGQTGLASNTITVAQGELAMGWTGYNSNVNTSSWVSGYTNKIYGLDTALVSIAPTEGSDFIAPIAAPADIDGKWLTPDMLQLGNGTYAITMTAYDGSDLAYSTPVGRESGTLTVTVDLEDLSLAKTSAGTGLALDAGGSATQGNWVQFDVTGSSVPDEATVAIYVTTASGEFVARDGTVGPGVTLEDSIRGYVGAVTYDDGTLMEKGSQSVYLPVGYELHFAVLSGKDTMETTPAVSITSDGPKMNLDVGGITMTAGVDNTLSDAENMAAMQRTSATQMVYLEHGASLDVSLSGSATSTNEVAFVRVDIDPHTGDISVGGVAYDDTEAFQEAVLQNLDPGFEEKHGSGDFDVETTWTVSGDDGYYVPVLITQSGDVFVPALGNTGGFDYIRTYGENTFGFEDTSIAQGSDFDFNDVVMRLAPSAAHAQGQLI